MKVSAIVTLTLAGLVAAVPVDPSLQRRGKPWEVSNENSGTANTGDHGYNEDSVTHGDVNVLSSDDKSQTMKGNGCQTSIGKRGLGSLTDVLGDVTGPVTGIVGGGANNDNSGTANTGDHGYNEDSITHGDVNVLSSDDKSQTMKGNGCQTSIGKRGLGPLTDVLGDVTDPVTGIVGGGANNENSGTANTGDHGYNEDSITHGDVNVLSSDDKSQTMKGNGCQKSIGKRGLGPLTDVLGDVTDPVTGIVGGGASNDNSGTLNTGKNGYNEDSVTHGTTNLASSVDKSQAMKGDGIQEARG
ncbi:uncharacterized protein ATNIH1004_004790 [Aspergillus tanneri]|uniref:Uncharacterized protein n=1 Tax=Aspergillus tanneri TaxID=1220188 RepID=A0A5M9MVJ7_9EURO|nr:uncharacterized protein ATNIH1004_004790 [Aspergillus tanneri]KAA8648903.1 hypothetical protein ATNIH1004_004790 [Aspergillus tanneri]